MYWRGRSPNPNPSTVNFLVNINSNTVISNATDHRLPGLANRAGKRKKYTHALWARESVNVMQYTVPGKKLNISFSKRKVIKIPKKNTLI